jgi:nucleoside-diphosphate-sugar epimerase
VRVAITGVSGHVGPFVAAEMASHGHEVVGVDLVPPSEPVGTFYSADVEDEAALVEAFRDCHAVVHLAAIRAPHIVSDEATYRINTVGTTCALEAAVRVGARRFVLASSDSALGFCFRSREMQPDYFPIDEDHPLRAQDYYGLSKGGAEEICRAATRRGDISTVCLRTCDVWYPARPDAVDVIVQAREEYRTLWVYVHALDVARAYRLACEATELDHATVFITAEDALANERTDTLVDEFYGNVDVRGRLGPFSSLISGERAKKVLGFVAQHRWRDDVSVPNDAGATSRTGSP